MTTRRRRGLVGLLVATALSAPAVITTVAAPASAAPATTLEEAAARFADCPELPLGVDGLFCINASVSDGQIKLGSTEAQISDPIDLTLAIGLDSEGNSVVVTPEEPAAPLRNPIEQLIGLITDRITACGRGVPISGGVLGQPALDPLLALDPLSLLCVSAEPTIGSPQTGSDGGFSFLGFVGGTGATTTLGVPISIQLNNLLFGDNCQIGSTAEPIMINLTNGFTDPPVGTTPIQGDNGTATSGNFIDPLVGEVFYATVEGARLVDNSFAVPGARQCDLLLGDLLNQPSGLFDSLINEMVGLPSAAGNNLASFALDTEMITYEAVHRGVLRATPASLDFSPAIPAGTASAPQTITVENVGNVDALVQTGADRGASGNFFTEGCEQGVLAPGETCELQVRFTPVNDAPAPIPFPGFPPRSLSIGGGAGSMGPIIENADPIPGTAPVMTAPSFSLDFGAVFVDNTSAPQTITLTNGGASPVTPDSIVTVPARHNDSFEIVSDGCTGVTIPPGGSCAVTLQVTPGFSSLSAQMATYEVRAADRSYLAAFSASAVGKLAVTAPALNFGTLPVGVVSEPQTATLTNISPSPVAVTRTVTTPQFPVVSDGCSGRMLAPGDTCQVTVRMAPVVVTSSLNTTLELYDGDLRVGGVPLQGASSSALQSPPVNFGSVAIGGSNGPTPVTITNASASPREIGDIRLNGFPVTRLASWAIVSDGCSGQTISAGGSCVVEVTFAPQAPVGNKNVNLEIRRVAAQPTATVVIALNGTAA